MDTSHIPAQTNAPAPAGPTDRAVLEFLAWRCDRLQTLFQFAVAGLIILSTAINMFLYKQMRLVRVQLPPQREMVLRYSLEFQKKDDPLIRNFVTKLQQFAAANPDFQPILEQYRTHLQAYFLPVAQKAALSQVPATTNKPRPTN